MNGGLHERERELDVISSALDEVAAGAGRVIVVGSDCPGLTTARIGEAWGALEEVPVVLGPATPGQIEEVLGARPHTTPTADMPPGRGYARLGTGPVLRLQVPATPDPYDDATSDVSGTSTVVFS